MSLRICLIAAEAAPLAKTGGLADVAAALTKHLQQGGHDARLFIPLYAQIDLAALNLSRVDQVQDVPLQVGPHSYRYSLLRAQTPGTTTTVHLIDCPALYHRKSLYTLDPDEHLRYIVLTRAALESCQRMGWSPQIVHAHDWHTALAPLYLKSAYAWDQLFASTRSVLTIHNIGYQGIIGAELVGDVGLAGSEHLLHQDDLRNGKLNLLKHGVLYADAITAVSPTYAREILTPEFGMGLEEALQQRRDALVGILNGVDYDVWDPRVDRYLPRQFDANSLEVKHSLKMELLARFKLKATHRTALLGIVSRFTAQKGLELLFESLPPVLAKRNVCLIALGNGEKRYESLFENLQQRFPQRVMYHRGYNDELAHWIEAASDIFLMPSLYEPCGLNQMYSLRYGTIPIVRRTGGLADSVSMFEPRPGRGTGIVFNDFNTEAMSWAMNTALDLYGKPKTWARLVGNAMAEDFSWSRQGALYVDLYERLLGGRAGASARNSS